MKQKRQDLYCNFPQIVPVLIFSVSMYICIVMYWTCWIRGGKERRRRGEGKGKGKERRRRGEGEEKERGRRGEGERKGRGRRGEGEEVRDT